MEDRAMSHRKETEAMGTEYPIEDWAQIPWRKLERKVYRLQKRIYQASLRGDDKVVHSLQRLLMRIGGRSYPCGTKSDAGQSWQAYGRNRRSQIGQSSASLDHGQTPQRPQNHQTKANQTSLDPKTRHDREKTIRHLDDAGSGSSISCQIGTGTRMR